MAIERRLTELAGPVGGKLHTARSRNDQVVTDLAMFTRERAADAQAAIGELMGVVLARAEEHLDWPLPGYTHLQRAQPVYLSHHLLAYFWMLARDRARFAYAEHEAGRLPLGAGALAGVNFDTDRGLVAAELGFREVSPNSIDAVSGRDFILDYLAAAATCSTHLSRLGAELVLWSSEEFGFCELPDAWSSGCSIMPQKKNPDAAELLRGEGPARGRAPGGAAWRDPRAAADLQQGSAGGQGAPVRRGRHDRADARRRQGMLAGVRFDRERMSEAASDELLAATDVADLLVRLRVPFREAHGVVAGWCVPRSTASGRCPQLTPEELAAHSAVLAAPQRAYHEALAAESWLESKISEGGTRLARVQEQIERPWRQRSGARSDAARRFRLTSTRAPSSRSPADLIGCVVEHAPAANPAAA